MTLLHTRIDIKSVNGYKIRKCDEADHLESIIAITRQKMFNEVMLDIFRILELGPYDKRILKNKENRGSE